MTMYLTVHRVASPRAERGINGALYRHDSDRHDPMWSSLDIARTAQKNLGTQVARRADVRPGGNAVETFLDVAFPDDFSEVELRTALSKFRVHVSSSRVDKASGLAFISFSQNLGEDSRALDNYDELQRAAIQLFRSYSHPEPNKRKEPIDLVLTRNDQGWRFELSEPSKSRLSETLGEKGIVSVSVPFTVADDFRRLYGELYPFVIEWVTHTSKDELAAMGGVRIFDGDKCVWKWPY